MLEELIDLNSISIIYKGNYISNVPNTYKAFLELIKDKENLNNEQFINKTIYIKDNIPILCKDDYIKQIKSCKEENKEKIEIYLASNDLDSKLEIIKKDYLEILESKEPEEPIKIFIKKKVEENTIYIHSNVNEFYAITQVKQYYINKNTNPVELSIVYPLKKEIHFKKFTLNIDGQISYSKILEKEKAEEKYSDAIAEGNVGFFSYYSEEEPNSYSINIGNISPKSVVELKSEFIQFLTSDDMSLCFSVMTVYPTFSDNSTRNLIYKDIDGKIILKTHSKITRLINKNFRISKDYMTRFNEDYTECNILFKILKNNLKDYYSNFNIIFRTEKMNKPYLLSQYNPEKDETSYIYGMIYNQKSIPIPKEPDTDINHNYYMKYQSDEKADTPSLFIFLIDQSGSMSGSRIKLVSESLLFFLQSLPKDSYFQLIGFGSYFEKINKKPVLYNKENVNKTMNITKGLEANLGGTDISTPLKDIFNSKDYDNINLGRNLFILTDGYVNNKEECLEIISQNCQKYKVHSFGIGECFDKELIQQAGLQGKGSFNYVYNISDINSVVINSLSKCLRNYLMNIKISLDKIKPEYEFSPKINFIYPDEILNYYFILKGKTYNENIQINFESNKKNDNFIFSNGNIIKEKDGEIIGQIIIGNILKNTENNLDENTQIKLSKSYQILSKKTSLFAVIEGEETNKIGRLKKVTNNNNNFNGNYYNSSIIYRGNRTGIYGTRGKWRGRGNTRGRNINYNRGYFENNNKNKKIDVFKNEGNNRFYNTNYNYKRDGFNYREGNIYYGGKYKKKDYYKYLERNNFSRGGNYYGGNYYRGRNDFFGEKRVHEGNNDYLNYYNNEKLNKTEYIHLNHFEKDFRDNNIQETQKDNEKFFLDKKNKNIKKEINSLNPKELVLTQDIIEGYWNINNLTTFLIEKEKEIYEKIEKITKEKNINKEEIKVTLLVLYFLKTNKSINYNEYSLIIKKGIMFLEKNGIDFNDIFSAIK